MSEYCDDKNFKEEEIHTADEVVVIEHEALTVKGQRAFSIGPKNQVLAALGIFEYFH